MNGVSRHLRASTLPSLIRSYGGIKSVCRFSCQSDGSSGGRFGEQGRVPGDSENKSGLPDPNASPSKSFSEIKAGLLNTGGNGSSTFSSFSEMRSGLLNKIGDGGYSAPNAPPTFRNPLRSRLPNTLSSQSGQMNQEGLPNTGGTGFSAPSYQSFTQSNLLKDNFRTGGISKDLDFVRGVIEDDEGRRATGLFSHFHRPNLETNADIIHIKLLRNNTFVTVTDSKGNVKCKATSGSLPDLKGGRKMTSYTADATAENIGRRVKAMGLKSVVVKVNGFTHFKKKRNAIVAFRSGYSNSRNDQNPIVYIEDTTRKAHNGCRLPRKRRV
ncbi:hypothetical protein F2Q70_00021492 [Brassica cretica]|uniref:Ribosomal protein S11 n=1 Tax=Brassica cretica TaxID=69181 RepID=A0A8S9GXX7_BRACR|nr:hypothetical protein F2Q70_00021492 [Brassica cretica]KAF2558097.1 hypothetical protein F2Q68_00015045 [Brassica cretica]